MKELISIIVIFICCSCDKPSTNPKVLQKLEDNKELLKIYEEDQLDRKERNAIDWSKVSKRDMARQKRVYELLDSNLLSTSLDFSNAAMIFQHGRDTTSSRMAVKMMEKAIELNPETNKWLLAAAIDRDLMRRDEPQIYGTQYIKQQNGYWEIYNLDTTKINDKERKEYGVETLKEQQEKVVKMNNEDLLNPLLGL